MINERLLRLVSEENKGDIVKEAQFIKYFTKLYGGKSDTNINDDTQLRLTFSL